MLHISRALKLLQDNKPHDVKFVAKGDEKIARKGGYVVNMRNSIVTSSNYKLRKLNLRSLDSKQTRWAYYILLIEVDGHEIFM